MSAFLVKSFSHYRCVEAALPFSAVAQRLQPGKAAKAHERNFYECFFSEKFLSLPVCRSSFTL